MKRLFPIFSFLFFYSFIGVGQVEDTSLARVYLDSIEVLLDSSRYDEVMTLSKKVVNIYESQLGTEDTLTARAYYKLGVEYERKDEYKKAIEFFQKAIDIQNNRLKNDHVHLADTYFSLGVNFYQLGKCKEATKYWENTLKIKKIVYGEDSEEAASLHNNLGTAYLCLSDYVNTISNYTKALEIRKKEHGDDHYSLNDVYNNIGIVYLQAGNYTQAREFFKKSLNLKLTKLGEKHELVSLAYGNMGEVYREQGRYYEAISYYKKAVNISIDVFGNDHYDQIIPYYNIGSTFLELGDYEKAINAFKRSLDLMVAKFGTENPNITRIYNGLSTAYNQLGDYEKAFEFSDKALSIELSKLGDNHVRSGVTYYNLGEIHENKQRYSEAKENYRKAIAIWNNYFGEANPYTIKAYATLGALYENENTDTSLVFYQKILDLSGLSLDDTTFEGLEYNSAIIPSVMRLMNLHQDSQLVQEKVIDFPHKLSDYFSNNIQSTNDKLEFQKQAFNIYETSLLLSKDWIPRNKIREFSFSEKNKATILLSDIRGIYTEKYLGLPDSLQEKDQNLKFDIVQYEKQLFNEEQKGESKSTQLISDYENKLFNLKREQELLLELFKEEYHDYYELKYNNTVAGVKETQSLLNSDQALIEYFVGDSSIFIFTLTQNEYEVTHLKKDFPLEEWVTKVREGIYLPEREKRNQSKKDSLYAIYAEAAYQLQEKLIATIPISLPKRLIIVPDGALGYLPFDALLRTEPKDARAFKEYDYLVKHHAISYNYSATLYQQILEKQHPKNRKPLLAVAPYFGEDRENLYAYERGTRAYRDTLTPLKYNVPEVEGIQNIIGGDILTHEAANMMDFQEKAKDYQIVHLSTHGKANDQVGDYSYLAFTELKDSIENEKLYTKDLYNLELNADMVVLSACETGLGELKRGEGIIGLTRGFTYAGAKSIVTTLWNVDDEGSQLLMQQFYKNLKDGKTKDVALQEAKLELLSKDKIEPFYWAGFIPIGDMAVLELDSAFSWWWGVAVFGVFSLLYVLFQNRKTNS